MLPMRAYSAVLLLISLLLAGCAPLLLKQDHISVRDQVFAVERAFAKSMLDRSLEDFTSFISEEAVFFSGPAPLHGKAQVIDWWKRYFTTESAPFSWEPDEVEVLASGTLALSSGPVRDPSGKIFARFTSIWRLEAPGRWRIIFDRGSPVVPAVTE